MKQSEGTTKAREKKPGLTIYNTKTSTAFAMISFMVGELMYVYDSIEPPIDLSVYKELSTDSFNRLKVKIFKNHKSHELISLSLAESIQLYMLVDLACKCLVSDTNMELKNMAIESLDVDEEEYGQLRINYLRYAQSLIEKMNDKFKDNREFASATAALKH